MPLSMIATLADLDRSATQRLVHTLETLGYSGAYTTPATMR